MIRALTCMWRLLVKIIRQEQYLTANNRHNLISPILLVGSKPPMYHGCTRGKTRVLWHVSSTCHQVEYLQAYTARRSLSQNLVTGRIQIFYLTKHYPEELAKHLAYLPPKQGLCLCYHKHWDIYSDWDLGVKYRHSVLPFCRTS